LTIETNCCFETKYVRFHRRFTEINFVTNLVPEIAVEREVDMEVLVMIIVKYGVWLPWLPPVSFEVDSRVVDDAVVICV
jgi:hypothetical protein